MNSRLSGAVVAAICFLADGAGAQDPPPVLSGRVVSAEDGRPIAGAHVYGPGGLVKAGADGHFAVPLKPESEDQALLARAEGYALHHEPVLRDSADRAVVIRLGPARVVVVRVAGEDGRPVRGATVHGRIPFAPAYSALERVDFDAVTDQDGIAIVTGIPADLPVVAEVRLPGMIPAQSGTLFPIKPPAPAEVAQAAETLTVTPGRSFRLVVEAAGKPVAGAAVNLLPLIEPRLDFGGHAARDTSKGAIRSATTDARGAAAFDHLPANPITCEVRAAGLITQLIVVEPGKGEQKPVRLRLRDDPTPPARDVPWRTSVAVATDEAKRLGRPVFLVMTMDGEKANDWMAEHHYHDTEVVRAAREVVPLLSSAFGEGGVGAADGHVQSGDVCKRYGTISCAAHQLVELFARETIMAERDHFEVPRHIAVTPLGARILHRVFYLSERDLIRLIVQSLRVVRLEDAVRLARERLATILEDAASADTSTRSRGARAIALLASSGDEHAAALLQALPGIGIASPARIEIAAALRPSALTSRDVTVRALLAEPDREVRRALIPRMSEVAADPLAMDMLAAELRSTDAAGREALLRALGVEKKGDDLRVPGATLGNRWRVVEELVELPAAGRVQGIEDILKDVERVGRHRILRALGRRAVADAAAQEILARATRGESAVAALRALAPSAAGAKPPPAVVKAFTDAAQSSDALVREEALRGIAASSIPVSADVLLPSIKHASLPVRIRAAIASWRVGDRSGQAILLAAVNDVEMGEDVKAAIHRDR